MGGPFTLNYLVSSPQGNLFVSQNSLTVSAPITVPTDKILEGTSIAGKNGTMPNMAARNPSGVGVGRSAALQSWTGGGSAVYLKPQKGYYDGVDTWTYFNVPNLTSANIKKGVDILGVTGTMSAGYDVGDRILLSKLGLSPEPRDTNGTSTYSGDPLSFNCIDNVGIYHIKNAYWDSYGNSSGYYTDLQHSSASASHFPIVYNKNLYTIVTSQDNVYYPDNYYVNLFRMDKNFSYKHQLDLGLTGGTYYTPSFLVSGEDGFLYAGFNGGSVVKKVNPNSFSVVATLNLSKGTFHATGAYVNASGNIFLSDVRTDRGGPRSNVYKYNQSGSLLGTYIGTTSNVGYAYTQWDKTAKSTTGYAGYVYIVDTANNLVKIDGNTMNPIWSYPIPINTGTPSRPQLQVSPDELVCIDYIPARWNGYESTNIILLKTSNGEEYYRTATPYNYFVPSVYYDGKGTLWWVDKYNSSYSSTKRFMKQQFYTVITG